MGYRMDLPLETSLAGLSEEGTPVDKADIVKSLNCILQNAGSHV